MMKKALIGFANIEYIVPLLTKHLASQEYRVEVFNDGAIAGKLIDTTDYDLIITEIVLPNKDGLELLEQYRSKNKYGLFIYISGIAGERAIDSAFSLGADGYIINSVVQGELDLLRLIDKCLSGDMNREDAKDLAYRLNQEIHKVADDTPTSQTKAKTQSNSRVSYSGVAYIIGAISFVLIWIYSLFEWGFLLGLIFGWIPAAIGGFIIGLAWPVLVLLLGIMLLVLLF